jgi:hypothetical protein
MKRPSHQSAAVDSIVQRYRAELDAAAKRRVRAAAATRRPRRVGKDIVFLDKLIQLVSAVSDLSVSPDLVKSLRAEISPRARKELVAFLHPRGVANLVAELEELRADRSLFARSGPQHPRVLALISLAQVWGRMPEAHNRWTIRDRNKFFRDALHDDAVVKSVKGLSREISRIEKRYPRSKEERPLFPKPSRRAALRRPK